MEIKEEYPIVGDKYILTDKLGAGSFGQIYAAINKNNNQKGYAVKFERKTGGNPTLTREARVLTVMGNQSGFPKLHYFSRNSEYLIMVMTLLGSSLESVFSKCFYRFSLKTVLMIAKQLLTLIENFHSKQLIHRDLKPDNYVIGLKRNSSLVHMIDFGLAKYYVDATGAHIPSRDGKGLIGTARYTSVNSHYGMEQSRRDDLESIGYVLIYFIKRRLPWQDIQVKNRNEKFRKIHAMKISTSLSGALDDIPVHFSEYMKYVRRLGFSEAPDYALLRRIFSTLFDQMRYKDDQVYDWNLTEEKRKEQYLADQQNMKNKDLVHYDMEKILKPKEKEKTIANPFKIQIKPEETSNQNDSGKKTETNPVPVRSPIKKETNSRVSEKKYVETVSLLDVPKISSVINLIGQDSGAMPQNNSLSTSRQANGSKLSSESDHGVEINFNLQTTSMIMNLESYSRDLLEKEDKENDEESQPKQLSVNFSSNKGGLHPKEKISLIKKDKEEDFEMTLISEISPDEPKVHTKLKHLVQSKKAQSSKQYNSFDN